MSNRYRDAPQQKDYDWMKLGTHVAEVLMVAGGIVALAAGGVFLVGAAAATAVKIGMTVFLAGSLYVGEQALSDVRSGRVSDLDQYTRKAVAGSVVGFLTGASGLLMTGASLGGVLALGFGEGLVGSIVTQKLLNEDGEIDWGVAIEGGGAVSGHGRLHAKCGAECKRSWRGKWGFRGGSGDLEGPGKNFTNTEAVSISGKRAIDYGQSYETAVRDLYGDVPFGQRQYEALVDGQWADGVADNVVQIGGKNTAIEAKYVDDWAASLRNPLSPNSTKPWALAEQ